MITASHNPLNDNGVKLVDPFGEMLSIDCEKELNQIINDIDDEAFDQLRKSYSTESPDKSPKPLVIIATDTRPSSPELLRHAIVGCTLANVRVEVFGW